MIRNGASFKEPFYYLNLTSRQIPIPRYTCKRQDEIYRVGKL